MKTTITTASVALALITLLSACSSDAPVEVLRPIRSVQLHYDNVRDVNRYFAAVQARHEVDQAFQVGGKVVERRVELGQSVRQGDVLAVLDAADYHLSTDGAKRQLEAAVSRQQQAASDWKRMQALKEDGSVSASDEERAKSTLETATAAAKAQSRAFELAQNQLGYTVLRASRSGVITKLNFEIGQVVPPGQPVIGVADDREPEIVVDVPEEHLQQFKRSKFHAFIAGNSNESFEVELREIAAQAATQTRTYRARLKPRNDLRLPLGASATLIAERVGTGAAAASIPATALTQLNGKPAVWAARPLGKQQKARVELVPVTVRGYRNEEVLVAGPKQGTVVVTAGIHKMAPGLIVAMPSEPAPAAADTKRGTP